MPPGPSLSVGSNDRYEASACSLCRVSIDDELLAVTRQHSEMFRMVISVSKWFIVTVGIDNGNAYSGRAGGRPACLVLACRREEATANTRSACELARVSWDRFLCFARQDPKGKPLTSFLSLED